MGNGDRVEEKKVEVGLVVVVVVEMVVEMVIEKGL